MYLCHAHRDTYSLCDVSTDAYLRYYVLHDIMQAFPFLWHSMTCNVLCRTKSDLGVRIQVCLVDPKYHTFNPA